MHFNNDQKGEMRKVGPGKWWWCVMVKENMFLYKQMGDSTAFRTIICGKVSFYDPYIKVVGSKEIFTFTTNDNDARKDWYSKIRYAISWY